MAVLTERYGEALQLAHRLHLGQLRKGTEIPYVSHVIAVSSIALDHGANEDEAIGALLHDAGEDAGGRETLELIRRVFGDQVAAIVDGCTDSYESPKPDWQTRKERYIARIEYASPSIRLVSAADKLHNATAIVEDYQAAGDALWSRFTGSPAQTRWYYRAIMTALSKHGRTPLLDKHDRVHRHGVCCG